MDFIVGILLMIIIILILINFTSISMSDTKANATCSRNSSSSSSNSSTNINKYLQNTNIPSPMLSNPPSALNNKINLNNQTYDYSKYFFM